MGHVRTRPLSFGITAGFDRQTLRHVAREIARLGYGSFWSNDWRAGDGLVALAEVAEAAPHLELGVGVLPFDRRPPSVIAKELTRLGIPLERLRLGVGAGDSIHPIGTVRGGVAELRVLLPRARVYVAALGPRMCELAGEIGDGVLLNWMTPDRIRWARERVVSGALKSNRAPAQVEVWAYVRAAVGPDARARLEAEARSYERLVLDQPHSHAYHRHFEAMAAPLEEVGVVGEHLSSALRAYEDVLDGTIVRALPATGDSEGLLSVARGARA